MRRTLIIILTWNRLNLTKETINTFIELNGHDHDFLFIDNNSSDKTVEWLRGQGFECVKNKRNMGVFRATRRGWTMAYKRGYEFILNLQNDFPSIRKVPFDDIYSFLDSNPDVGFVQLNDKKYIFKQSPNGTLSFKKTKRKTRNVVTNEKINYQKGVIYGETKFIKSNYHLSFNPAIIRSSIIPHLVYEIYKPRERQIMERFEQLKLRASKVRKRCFQTIMRKREPRGWAR